MLSQNISTVTTPDVVVPFVVIVRNNKTKGLRDEIRVFESVNSTAMITNRFG